jgi:hypothetical protein
MRVTVLNVRPDDVAYLDDVLNKPQNASDLEKIPNEHLRVWCVLNAYYQIISKELLEWLHNEIKGRRAIEVGAGNNLLGHCLGITSTDSYVQQTNTDLQAYYSALGQRPTKPDPAKVDCLDAVEAIRKYEPEVVIGSWLTHKWEEGMSEGSIYGPDERKIVEAATYIHIGNKYVHSQKPILRMAHRAYGPTWLFSRAEKPDGNRIWVWDKVK